MRKLVVEKTYDKFTGKTDIFVGNCYMYFCYHSTPTDEILFFSNDVGKYEYRSSSSYYGWNEDLILIDDQYRYATFSPLSEDDLLRFCNAKSIEVNERKVPIILGNDKQLVARSAIPAAKLMYNTLFSAHFFDDDEIQREWRDTGCVVENTMRRRSFWQEHWWHILFVILFLCLLLVVFHPVFL